MQYWSTRGYGPVSLADAIMSGTAPDGGLFVPEALPAHDINSLADSVEYQDLAIAMLKPFVADGELESQLPALVGEAFNFPVPVRNLPVGGHDLSVLELFHGPTAAFKDFGARFLAASMSSIVSRTQKAGDTVADHTILVATSGDTGGAVASAFHRRPHLRVVVLFPAGRVSRRQQHQLTCWGDNVLSLAVSGEFDDCQRMVKQAFTDAELARTYGLCSANSINVGRLLPQSVYYGWASLANWRRTGQSTNFIVPTGNLGNAFAAVWARQMGLPIDRIIFATNANRTIVEFLEGGAWAPRATQKTLASAMDVGNPSNMERLRHLVGDARQIGQIASAVSVTDEEIRAQIEQEHREQGLVWCPHTATAFRVYRELAMAERATGPWTVVATAHAAKFDEIVEPLVGEPITPPKELAKLLDRPSRFDIISPDLAALAEAMDKWVTMGVTDE